MDAHADRELLMVQFAGFCALAYRSGGILQREPSPFAACGTLEI
jgi:hypothetical protein